MDRGLHPSQPPGLAILAWAANGRERARGLRGTGSDPGGGLEIIADDRLGDVGVARARGDQKPPVILEKALGLSRERGDRPLVMGDPIPDRGNQLAQEIETRGPNRIVRNAWS